MSAFLSCSKRGNNKPCPLPETISCRIHNFVNSAAQHCKLSTPSLTQSVHLRDPLPFYLFARLELLAVEAVEEEGEEEVEHHEVPHDEGGQEDGKAGLGNALKSNKINF